MPNPISKRIRGWILVAGIIFGIMSTTAGPLILALHVSSLWAAVVMSAIGAVLTLVSTLSRANLADPQSTAPAPKSVTIPAPPAVG